MRTRVALLSALALAACARRIPNPPACPCDCTSFGFASAPAPTQTGAFVHRAGAGIVDESGAPLKLRGVSLGGWLLWEGWIWGAKLSVFNLSGHAQSAIAERLALAAGTEAMCSFRDRVRTEFVTEDDIAAIAQAGFNAVRVPLNHRDFDCDGAPGWAVLDRLLDWCERHQVYAVLDLHSAPGGQSNLFIADPEAALLFDSPQAQARTVALWRAIARRYASRRIVAGYDLLNEPIPGSGKDLAALYRQIIAGIREVDAQHMLILEGADFARDFSMFTEPLDANQIYSFHLYTWFGDDRRSRLAGFAKVAAAQGVPMWCGEFGENSAEVISSTLDLFDAQAPALAGWSFWTWKRTSASRWSTLHGLALPQGWKRLIEWAVNNTGSEPSPEAARAAMGELLACAARSQLTTDARLDDILASHARR